MVVFVVFHPRRPRRMIRKGTASKKLNPRAGVVVTPLRLSSSSSSESRRRRRLGKRLSLSLSLSLSMVVVECSSKQRLRNFKRFFLFFEFFFPKNPLCTHLGFFTWIQNPKYSNLKKKERERERGQKWGPSIKGFFPKSY